MFRSELLCVVGIPVRIQRVWRSKMKRASIVIATISSATVALVFSVWPSTAAEREDLRAQFRRYDSDQNGQVTAAELTDPQVFALNRPVVVHPFSAL